MIAKFCCRNLSLLPKPPSILYSSPHSTRWQTNTVSYKFFSTTSTSFDERPFKVLGLQQVAIGALDKSSLTHLWTDVLGVPKIGTFQSERENVDEDILCLGSRRENSSFSVELDLMSPLDPDGKPKVHSPPLNHIGLWVDDLPAAVDWMKAKGVRFAPGGIRKGASGHDITFIHPKANDESPIGGLGVLIELVQAPPHVIEALGSDDNDAQK